MPYQEYGPVRPHSVQQLDNIIKRTMIFADGAAAHSAGFEPGVRGWIIRSDGSVEFNDAVFRGDIMSGNWDGADPADLSSGEDTTATAGYYFDGSAGSAQFMGTTYTYGKAIFGSETEEHIKIDPASLTTTIYFDFSAAGLGGFQIDNAGYIFAYSGAGGAALQIGPMYDSTEKRTELLFYANSYAMFQDSGDTGDTHVPQVLQIDINETDTAGLRVTTPASYADNFIELVDNGTLRSTFTTQGLFTDHSDDGVPHGEYISAGNHTITSASTYETAYTKTYDLDQNFRYTLLVSASAIASKQDTTPANMIMRVQYSTDGGSTWNSNSNNRTDAVSQTHQDQQSISCQGGVSNTALTGTLQFRIQCWSSSNTNAAFNNIVITALVLGAR